MEKELAPNIFKSMDGFIFILSQEGKILYISETASVLLGLSQVEMTGNEITEYLHPLDHEELKQILTIHPSEIAANAGQSEFTLERSFFLRVKCVLAKRNAGLTTAGFKVIHCNGHLRVRVIHLEGYQYYQNLGLISFAYAIPSPNTNNTEIRLSMDMFMFRASLDLKLIFLEGRITQITGFQPQELVDKTLYQLVHAADVGSLKHSHEILLTKGQVTTPYYRLLNKSGGWIWIQSYATIVHNSRSSRPNCIVSVNYLLSELEFSEYCLLNDPLMYEDTVGQHQQAKTNRVVTNTPPPLQQQQQQAQLLPPVQPTAKTMISYENDTKNRMNEYYRSEYISKISGRSNDDPPQKRTRRWNTTNTLHHDNTIMCGNDNSNNNINSHNSVFKSQTMSEHLTNSTDCYFSNYNQHNLKSMLPTDITQLPYDVWTTELQKQQQQQQQEYPEQTYTSVYQENVNKVVNYKTPKYPMYNECSKENEGSVLVSQWSHMNVDANCQLHHQHPHDYSVQMHSSPANSTIRSDGSALAPSETITKVQSDMNFLCKKLDVSQHQSQAHPCDGHPPLMGETMVGMGGSNETTYSNGKLSIIDNLRRLEGHCGEAGEEEDEDEEEEEVDGEHENEEE
ncbi:unnamed protein product [Trichobilharzia szidati]|nr:unnamed protein product [Trichobilharzia szidati]